MILQSRLSVWCEILKEKKFIYVDRDILNILMHNEVYYVVRVYHLSLYILYTLINKKTHN